jgi:hypothetical protein
MLVFFTFQFAVGAKAAAAMARLQGNCCMHLPGLRAINSTRKSRQRTSNGPECGPCAA